MNINSHKPHKSNFNILLVVTIIITVIVLFGAVRIRIQNAQKEGILPVPAAVSKEKIKNSKGFITSQLDKIPEKSQSLEDILKNIKILTTFILNDKAIAIIREVDASRTGTYGINDQIRGAQIIKISLDGAVFSKDGEKKAVFIKRKALTRDAMQELSSYDRLINRQVFMNTYSIQAMVQEIDFIPRIEEGKIKGVEITRISADSVVADMGLREGDIVRSVNGVTLSNLSQAFELLKSYKDDEVIQISVEIERKNPYRLFNKKDISMRHLYTYIVF